MGTIVEPGMTAEIVAVQQLEEAAKFLDLEPWILHRLRHCDREVTVNLEIIRDNGEPTMFRGTRVQHCAARGPYMGPLLFSKNYSLADAHALSMQLTWQSALWDLPFGGSAGLIATSLDDLSERESRLLTRAYVESLEGTLSRDVITPDRGGHPEVNAWALAALGKTERERLAAITGKPPSLCGVDRERIASLFLRGLTAAALREQGKKLEGSLIAIAGFDVESRQLVSALDDSRARVVAVGDRSGAVFQRNGLDIHLLTEFFSKEGVVFGYPDAEAISGEEMSQLNCDVLILTSGQELRLRPKAQLVVEAGGSVSCMMRKDTVVLPSLLGDAGHRFADYLEWRKTACGELSDRELLRGVQAHVRNTWSEVWKYARHYSISIEQAAMAAAVSKVAQAMRMG